MAENNLTATGQMQVANSGNSLIDSLGFPVHGAGTLVAHADNEISYYFHGADNFIDENGKTSYSVEWTEAEKDSLRASLQAFSAVSNLTFVETATSDVKITDLDIRLADTHYDNTKDWSSVRAYSSAAPYSFDRDEDDNDVVYRSNYYWDETHFLYEDYNHIQQKDNFTTQLHEFGHSMGLQHPHSNGGKFDNVTSASDRGDNGLNDQRYTVMSYNETPMEGNNWLNYMGSSTLMVLDIAAIQHLYGANMNIGAGHNTYKLEDVINKTYKAIWDAGGNDKIEYSGKEDVVIDLRAGHLDQEAAAITGEGIIAHNYNGAAGYYNGLYDGNQYDDKGAELWGGYYIANGVIIENAQGGSGDDRIIGNDANNSLYGGNGNDTLIGGAGADYMDGGSGFDTVSYAEASSAITIDLSENGRGTGDAKGDSFNSIEKVIASHYKDIIYASASGNMVFDGGNGHDIVTYEDESISSGITIDLADNSKNTGAAAGSSFVSIETIKGSNHSDIIYGDDNQNYLYGHDGHDTIYGRGGSDYIYGGDGNDTIYGGMNGEGYGSFYGEDGDDVIYGRGYLYGGDGNDKLIGSGSFMGGKGNDIFDGSSGHTTVYYSYREKEVFDSIVVDLMDSSRNRGEAANDTLISIESIWATNSNDALYGDNGGNYFQGREGDDIIFGRGGNDTIYGNQGNDALFGGAGDDKLNCGSGRDFIDGGEGFDILSYQNYWDHDVRAGVTVNLKDPSQNKGEAADDTYISIEGLEGTKYGDFLYGDDANNQLIGDSGNDYLYGGAGDDSLHGFSTFWRSGERGNDTLYGGTGNDKLYGAGGSDDYIFDLGDGHDYIDEYGGYNNNSGETDRIIFQCNYDEVSFDLSMKGSNLFIDLAGDNSITINRWTASSYRIEEFVFDDMSFTADAFLAANGLSI